MKDFLLFIVENYLVHITVAFIASLAIIWQLFKIYPSFKFMRRSKESTTLVVHIFLSFLFAIPTGIISGNFFHIKNKQEVQKAFRSFRQEFISKVHYTKTEIWGHYGWSPGVNTNIPWPDERQLYFPLDDN